MGQSVCPGYDTITIVQYPAFKIEAFSYDNTIRCQGHSTQLYAKGASAYEWSPAEFCSDKNSASPIVSPTQTTLFTVVGKDVYGCKGKDTISVFYEGESTIHLPNAFTPNNDQVNDRFFIVDNYNFTLFLFNIYNRWGQIVFSGHSLSAHWDGTFNGKECEAGTYFYLIKGKGLNGNEILFKGDLTLVR